MIACGYRYKPKHLKIAPPTPPCQYPAYIGAVYINGEPGYGLFAERNVDKGETVAEYGGRLVYRDDLTNAECQKYAVMVQGGQPSPLLVEHYDDTNTQDENTKSNNAFGRYINCARGRQGLTNNVKIVLEYETGAGKKTRDETCAAFVRVKFVAKRVITQGEEFCVDYGAGYPY